MSILNTIQRFLTPSIKRMWEDGVNWQPLFTMGGGVVDASGDAKQSLAIYSANPWVFPAVTAQSYAMFNATLKIRKKLGNDEFEKIDEHQAIDLLRYPDQLAVEDGASHLSGGLLMFLTYQHLLLTGESFWLIGNRTLGNPSQIDILYPDKMQVNKKNNRIESYTYWDNGQKVTYQPSDVIHLKLPNPQNIFRGQSQITASSLQVETDQSSSKWLWNFFKQNASPRGILQLKDKPTPEQLKRLKEAWGNDYAGIANAGKTPILYGGEYKTVGVSQRDMQHKELKEYDRDTILANMRIGKGILGMMEDQSRANADDQEYAFTKHVITPMLTLIIAQLNDEYLSRFSNVDNLEIYIDSIVPDDEELKNERCKIGVATGYMTPNEARSIMGMEPFDDEAADRLYMPAAMAPINDQLPSIPNDQNPDDL